MYRFSHFRFLVATLSLAACVPIGRTIYQPIDHEGYRYTSCSGAKESAYRQIDGDTVYAVTTESGDRTLLSVHLALYIRPGAKLRFKTDQIALYGNGLERVVTIEAVHSWRRNQETGYLEETQYLATDWLIGYQGSGGPLFDFLSKDWENWGPYWIHIDFEGIESEQVNVVLPELATGDGSMHPKPISLKRQFDVFLLDPFCT